MGELGRAGTAFQGGGAAVGLLLPGVGAALATLGQVANVIDPTSPDPRYELPPEWRAPYAIGPLWGLPEPAALIRRRTWTVRVQGVNVELVSDAKPQTPRSGSEWIGPAPRDPLAAGWAALTAFAPLRWLGGEGPGVLAALRAGEQLVGQAAALAQQEGPRPESQVTAYLDSEAVRRGGAERLVGHRLVTQLGPIEVLAAGPPQLRIAATATEAQIVELLGQWQAALLQFAGREPSWSDIDTRPWETAWLDWWHDRVDLGFTPAGPLPKVFGPGPGPFGRRAWIDGRAPGAADARELHEERRSRELERQAERQAEYSAWQASQVEEAARQAYLADVQRDAAEAWDLAARGVISPEEVAKSFNAHGEPPAVVQAPELAPRSVSPGQVAAGAGALIAALLLL